MDGKRGNIGLGKASGMVCLAIFLISFCSSNLFWHSHKINDRIIVHSHFFWHPHAEEDAGSSADPIGHTHTGDQLNGISIILHSVQMVSEALHLPLPYLHILQEIQSPYETLSAWIPAFHNFLRGPPQIF